MGTVLCGRNCAQHTNAKLCHITTCKRQLCAGCTESRVTRIKESWQVPVRISKDKVLPTITGCNFMASGQLVLCDAANRRIKVLDRFFDIKRVIDLSGSPYDVGILDDETIIVSMPATKRIKFIQIFPALMLGHSLYVGLTCYGIDVAKEEIFVACHSTPRDICLEPQINVSEVRIYSMHGEIQKRVSLNTCTYCFSVDSSGRNIYVLTSCGILCVSKAGEVIFQYVNGNFNQPSSQCLDEDNNIIVCCADSLKVITASGKRYTTLANMCDVSGTSTGKTFMPSSVALRRSDRTLVVAGDCTSKLLVYKFM